MSFEPWVKYPALTEERLTTVAGLFQTARRGVVALYEPSKGDEPWCLGCRAYSWMRHAIKAEEGKLDWLRVLPDPEKALRFTFTIGSIPLRFFTGWADDPPSRSLAVAYMEIRQQRLAFDMGAPKMEGILRLAIETDVRGLVSRVTLVELDASGNVVDDYEIPLGQESSNNVIPFQAPSIDLPAPTIQALRNAEDERQDRDAG